MDARELRIGNYIQYFGNIVQVEGIVNESNGFGLQLNGGDFASINSQSLEPIPLTEEWLLKFGFEWSIRHQAWHKLSFIFDLSERGVGGYYMHMVKKNNDIICSEIIYVHQLQNLYFALTGEELTIKTK